ncbi:hypothetical protein CDD83_3325 [Cordyceps sp. RAO-2017]|nr:hypothetical protein CDD83_3325 [Cordyceps sp. RAO-2017]
MGSHVAALVAVLCLAAGVRALLRRGPLPGRDTALSGDGQHMWRDTAGGRKTAEDRRRTTTQGRAATKRTTLRTMMMMLTTMTTTSKTELEPEALRHARLRLRTAARAL